ncbi:MULTISPECIES: RICIN domain-containing protein [unclassified Crossiella]|uniref:RICIN domain-containing protein n=1 Tax=unclassified Crossiella TaxID=2620835 RepID=UPI001FFF9C64|nr:MULTISPECIES: RICIN domain-containing protein [unclassified Crossiella]MCK2239627.1 RICIN domain-containing protein [Crossiella sp. S99.2]MCK2252322.1 RICIN domain-containing protein [Crossiella sp. S99.1]
MATAAAAAVVAASSLTLVSAPAAQAAITPDAWYKVVSKTSGKCVDARGAAAANGTAVQQYTCNDSTAQQWQFQESGGGFFRLNSRIDAAQAIDVAENSTADGGQVHLWTYGGGANQQWQPVEQADGSYRLVNRNSGKCFDLTEGSQADSVQFQQWSCFAGSPNQSFNLVPVDGGGPGPGDPDFGPNVFVFDQSTPQATIQSRANTIFQRQERAQFGADRYAMLFKPGAYNVDVNVGYYTQVLGLGRNPDDVHIRGAVHVEADWFQGNATHNFWRAAENLSVTPAGGTDRWAVSQAAPYRRMHVRGNLQLDDNGWSSGGFMADSKIDGQVRSGSQQQWLSRNTNWGSWTGSNWNMVFVGANNAPAGNFPSPPYTRVDQTPQIREKPFLQVNSSGGYEVFVPALRNNSRGTTWEGGNAAGQALPISSFFIAKPGTSAAAMNQALAEGKNLIVTPGIYRLDQTLRVTRPDTVVLGLGLATLMPNNGITAMTVADVPGVKIAGLLIDANTTNSNLLMEVGPAGSAGNHGANPTSLHDLFIRIGGMVAGKATTSLVVNSRNVIGDHLWLWRGDHGDGIGWNTNTADVGLVVNGDNVSMYGLFVEHYQKYQTIWNGQGGKTFFYQNEMPYDPPNQAAWMNGSTRGYAAYKVANHVTSHEAYGLGSYCFFNVNRSVVADRAFEVPNNPNVRFRNMVTVSLGGGAGTINRIINNSGGTAGAGQTVQYLVNYP